VVLSVINQLEQTSGNARIEALRAGDSELLRTILLYTYNPRWTYGIKQVPEWSCHDERCGHNLTIEQWLRLLDRLAARELTGHAAQQAVAAALHGLAHVGGPRLVDLCTRVLLRDLRVGLNTKSINKVFPDLVPVHQMMLAQPYEEKRLGDDEFFIIDWKNDGFRCEVKADAHDVELLTRNGNIIKGFDQVRFGVQELVKVVGGDLNLDGELMVPMFVDEDEGVDRAAAMPNVPLVLFDLISTNAVTEMNESTPLHRRLAFMQKYVNLVANPFVHHSPAYVSNNRSHIDIYFRHVLDQGGEGVMVKRYASPYVRKRSYDWMKYKPTKDIDLVIHGWFEGEKGKKFEGTLGGFLVMHGDVEVRVPPGKGIKDKKRHELWEKREACVGQTLEIQYLEETPDGSLRHPRFVRLRANK
jgi:DNA ligase-1